MSALSRRKGKTGELEVVHVARAAGFHDAARTSDGRHQRGRGDVSGVPAVSVEVKRVDSLRLRESWAQTVAQAGPDLPVLAHRWDKGEWLAVLPLDELFALLQLRDR